MKLFKIACAALLAAGIGAAASANAFTYDNRTNQNPDGSAKFQDPEDQLQNGSNSRFSVHFSGSGSGYGNGSNQDSGYDSRFVPSANGAFSAGGSAGAMNSALGDRHW